jgi:hypothetical protein
VQVLQVSKRIAALLRQPQLSLHAVLVLPPLLDCLLMRTEAKHRACLMVAHANLWGTIISWTRLSFSWLAMICCINPSPRGRLCLKSHFVTFSLQAGAAVVDSLQQTSEQTLHKLSCNTRITLEHGELSMLCCDRLAANVLACCAVSLGKSLPPTHGCLSHKP